VKWLRWIPMSLFILGGDLPFLQSVEANTTNLFIKPSVTQVVANQEFQLDFYLVGPTDLFGLQIDMATSLNQGALPFEPINKSSPFITTDSLLFKNDLILMNKFDATKEVASLLVTRHLSETTGYNVNKVKLVASIGLKALIPVTTFPEIVTVGDDLLSMQLGITNITFKLSTAIGQKITYSLASPDLIKPVINLSQQEATIALNETFNLLSMFSVTDNRSLESDLVIQTSNFHDINTEGEYLITILAVDEFNNFNVALFKLIVGDPYLNIEVTYANA
jgi:hypothetical protein